MGRSRKKLKVSSRLRGRSGQTSVIPMKVSNLRSNYSNLSLTSVKTSMTISRIASTIRIGRIGLSGIRLRSDPGELQSRSTLRSLSERASKLNLALNLKVRIEDRPRSRIKSKMPAKTASRPFRLAS